MDRPARVEGPGSRAANSSIQTEAEACCCTGPTSPKANGQRSPAAGYKSEAWPSALLRRHDQRHDGQHHTETVRVRGRRVREQAGYRAAAASVKGSASQRPRPGPAPVAEGAAPRGPGGGGRGAQPAVCPRGEEERRQGLQDEAEVDEDESVEKFRGRRRGREKEAPKVGRRGPASGETD